MMIRLLVFALSLSCSCISDAIDNSKFKRCHENAFCRRNRHSTDNRRYRLLPNTIVAEQTTVTARLENEATKREFMLQLNSIKGGIVRFQVTEPAVERYRVKDVLINDPPPLGESWLILNAPDKTTLRLSSANIIVVLSYNPFRLTLTRDGREVIGINENNLFHIEHSRQHEDEAEDGLWEESFHNFRDTKPKGPQAISLDVTYGAIQHVFGIPEHSTHMSLPVTYDQGQAVSEPYRLYNLDVFEYELNSPFSLYGSIPFLLGQNLVDSAGLFWLNTAEMYIDIWKDEKGTHSQWIAESGVVDVFLMTSKSAKETLLKYTSLTGTTALPQYFAISYHQCRWNYKDEADVKQVDAKFDEEGIPYDVLWLDIEHTDQKKYMTWDSHAFPNPIAMQDDLASRGRKMVTIVDPHIKNDDHYSVYREAKKLGYYVKNKDGSDFVGHCWPGSSSYLDVTRPEVRSWWAGRFQPKVYQGMTKNLYIWNDMNEPSVFNGPEITMQKDLLHSGSIEHREVHNLYGFYYHMATAEGLKQRGVSMCGADGDRPFVLSRAFYAGSQRIGPIWTGDNAAEWDHLKASIPMLLTNSLAGMAFCGADISGFFGNPDAELFTRWYQVGVFYPFVRAHAHIETKRREPWLFGDETTTRIKNALRERYALLPYIYTVFRASHLTGEPIMRPLWYEFLIEALFDTEEAFMLGPSLMIHPILHPGVTEADVYFPPETVWFNIWTGQKIETTPEQPNRMIAVTLDRIPCYYRGGSIVARKERPRRSTEAMKHDPITLIIALDKAGKAEGEIYIDDGSSFAYLRHEYLHRRFSFSDNELTSINLNTVGSDIEFSIDVTVEKIVFLGMHTKLDVFEKSSSRQIEAVWGPLRLEQGAPVVGLVIKKPLIYINSDWTLILSPPKQ